MLVDVNPSSSGDSRTLFSPGDGEKVGGYSYTITDPSSPAQLFFDFECERFLVRKYIQENGYPENSVGIRLQLKEHKAEIMRHRASLGLRTGPFLEKEIDNNPVLTLGPNFLMWALGTYADLFYDRHMEADLRGGGPRHHELPDRALPLKHGLNWQKYNPSTNPPKYCRNEFEDMLDAKRFILELLATGTGANRRLNSERLRLDRNCLDELDRRIDDIIGRLVFRFYNSAEIADFNPNSFKAMRYKEQLENTSPEHRELYKEKNLYAYSWAGFNGLISSFWYMGELRCSWEEKGIIPRTIRGESFIPKEYADAAYALAFIRAGGRNVEAYLKERLNACFNSYYANYRVVEQHELQWKAETTAKANVKNASDAFNNIYTVFINSMNNDSAVIEKSRRIIRETGFDINNPKYSLLLKFAKMIEPGESLRAMRILLENLGADIGVRDENGHDALYYASQRMVFKNFSDAFEEADKSRQHMLGYSGFYYPQPTMLYFGSSSAWSYPHLFQKKQLFEGTYNWLVRHFNQLLPQYSSTLQYLEAKKQLNLESMKLNAPSHKDIRTNYDSNTSAAIPSLQKKAH